MISNNTTVITKSLKLAVLAALLLAAVIPAAGQSMIPDDFDWSVYLQDWNDSWYDTWGSTPQDYSYNYGYQEPITYDWYGQTVEIDPWDSAPAPQTDPYSYSAPNTTTQTQENIWNNESFVQQIVNDSDIWFYQEDGFYDDFEDWAGSVPTSAYVNNFVGHAQSYTLDCETRSAVDLAGYFGVNIAHYEFLNRLPKSDDPNEGFVGNVNDPRGKIPPSSYGVYQEPVAALLRSYGLNAVGVYGFTENALKVQLSYGRPVMVWVVGNTEVGYSVPYTPASTGKTTLVVPYQHTVVVIGYDANNVMIQDGAQVYTRTWPTFMLSWGALGNRAIYVN